MMRSLYSGVSGLRNHQTRMDVIGNNIANVNTTGFKASRTVFQDIYSQTISAASAGSAELGGTNPSQIGLGVKLGAIDTLFTPGATQRTDNPSDLAIENDGFFIVDMNGTPEGGTPGTNGGLRFTRAGNFYVDNSGNLVTSNGYFVMGYNVDYVAADPDDPDSETTVTYPSLPLTEANLININLADYTNITFDEKGVVWGYNENNLKIPVAQVAMAMFTNNSGLEKKGNSLYDFSASSGEPTYTIAGQLGAGSINPGGLEMANVDLAAEFTDMIITQRGFQANSRIITVSDSMLEELVNLKR